MPSSSYTAFPGIAPGAAGTVVTSTGAAWTAQAIPVPVTPSRCEGRLTLSSTLPVTTADFNNITSLYYLPYLGNHVSLYSGSAWQDYTLGSSGLTLSLSGLAVNCYDVYLDWNSGSPVLGLIAWANTTTRSVTLNQQDNIYYVGSFNTRRYLGTIYCNNVGQCTDAAALRGVWNYANRINRHLLKIPAAANWTYTTVSTWRQAGGDAANQVAVVIGLDEDSLIVKAEGTCQVLGGAQYANAIGLDSASTPVSGSIGVTPYNASSSTFQAGLSAAYSGHVGIGYHYLTWLEYTAVTASSTPYVAGTTGFGLQSGLWGNCRS